ncbi:hypothetical protein ABW19_dt0202283 [Dactylella cylindrospora]|nr:hypothetical protein ABW19_dt0202283 [Dactylella cylindrospora]
MAFKIDHQSPQIRALSETISVPPFIPPASSPSTKRKRDVLLYISPVSANSSFNSSTAGSFGGDGTVEGVDESTKPGGIGEGEAVVGGGAVGGEVRNGKPNLEELNEEVDIPSPRTKVANKLEGLDLSGDRKSKEDAKPLSKAAKVVKTWRKAPVGKFTGFPEAKNSSSVAAIKDDMMTGEAMPLDNEKEGDEDGLTGTPKKKKRPTIEDPSGGATLSSPGGEECTPKKRKGKSRAMFAESAEVEMTTPDPTARTLFTGDIKEDSESSNNADGPVVFVGSQGRRRLRSPPPSIAEDDENLEKKPGEEEDTDSDLDQTGIGFRPTPQQREIRNQKRMQQVKEYKARESREARAKRTAERRRRNVAERGASAASSTSSLIIGTPGDEGDEMDDVQRSSPAKKVHFAL